MKILMIGSGGREHALIKKLLESPKCTKLYCAPGNGGISRDAEIVNIGVMHVVQTGDDQRCIEEAEYRGER